MPVGEKLFVGRVEPIGDRSSPVAVERAHFMHHENCGGQFDFLGRRREAAFGEIKMQIDAAIPLDPLKILVRLVAGRRSEFGKFK